MNNKSIAELRTFRLPPFLITIVAEASSIFLNENQRWNTFYQKSAAARQTMLSVDYNQLSDQILYDLGMIINVNRSNINTIYNVTIGAGDLFCWLATTYDWAIAIRDNFPQFTIAMTLT